MTCAKMMQETNSMRRINYKEDFEIVIQLMQDGYAMPFPDVDFVLTFKSFSGVYLVGRRDGVYHRCRVEDGKLRCFLDNHGLSVGRLTAELKIKYPSEDYADGSRSKIILIGGDVELIAGNTVYTNADWQVPMEVILIDAYELAKRKGYVGSAEDFYSTFTLISDTMKKLREAGKQVSDVISSEQERVENEAQRVEAENIRIVAARQAQEAYNTYATSEQQRQESETERTNNEIARVQAEQQREAAERLRGENSSTALSEIRTVTTQANSLVSSLNEKDESLTEKLSENSALFERLQANTQNIENAEQQRITNESVRIQAEQQREEAERVRGENSSTALSEIHTVTTQANDLVSSLNAKDKSLTEKLSENSVLFERLQANTRDIENAEQQRITNENARIQAETLRVQNTTDAIKRVDAAIGGIRDGKDGRLAKVNHGTSDAVFALTANVMHVWEETSSLDLSIDRSSEDPEYLAEYAFQFTCPTSAGTNLVLPSDIKWYNGLVVVPQAGKTYQASIVNNIIIMGEA